MKKTTDVVSTGLNCDQSHQNAQSGLEVTCIGDPGVGTGDKVPIVIKTKHA